jgi:hypothetical protein
MPIDQNHQIAILTDILKTQQLDCCATTSEYEQIARLTGHLLEHNQVPAGMRETLELVRHYGVLGKTNDVSGLYVHQNQNQLNDWVETLEQSTLEY